jgi:hypothetical protein
MTYAWFQLLGVVEGAQKKIGRLIAAERWNGYAGTEQDEMEPKNFYNH